MAECGYQSPVYTRAIWSRRLARVGLITKGTVYILIGLFAARTVVSDAGRVIGAVGVLQMMLAQPFGFVLLTLAVCGLAAYVLWRASQALAWDRPQGAELASVWRRLGYGINGLAYASLTFGGIEVLTGSPVGTQEAMVEGWTNRLDGHPLGVALILLAGLFLIGVGASIAIQGVTASFRRYIDLEALSGTGRTWALCLGQLGRLGRAAIYATLGLLLMQAGLQHEPERAAGLKGALLLVAEQPLGMVLLGALAAGLVAYGISLLGEAWQYGPPGLRIRRRLPERRANA